jgi:hypothetical protein
MRIVHWLFLVSVALFLSGIGFIVAAARTARDSPPQAEAVVATPVASVKQIMKGIVGPAATVVFTSVSFITTDSGVEAKAPRSDEDWEVVANNAVALAEGGNLLMMDGRAVDSGEWMKMSRAMIDAAKIALKAAEAKNVDDMLEVGGTINVSCDNCHRRYQRG